MEIDNIYYEYPEIYLIYLETFLLLSIMNSKDISLSPFIENRLKNETTIEERIFLYQLIFLYRLSTKDYDASYIKCNINDDRINQIMILLDEYNNLNTTLEYYMESK